MEIPTKEAIERLWKDAIDAQERNRARLSVVARWYAEASEAATLAHQAVTDAVRRHESGAAYARALIRREEKDKLVASAVMEAAAAMLGFHEAEKEVERVREQHVRHFGHEPKSDAVSRYIAELRVSQGVRR